MISPTKAPDLTAPAPAPRPWLVSRVPEVTALAAGDRLAFDIDQIGSGTAGSGLAVSVTVKRLNV